MPETPPHGTPIAAVRGWQEKRIAPMSVQGLNAAGGRVKVDATGCYEGLARWRRTVAWSDRALVVEDDVGLADQPEVVLFHWHLGTSQEVTIRGDGTRATTRPVGR